MDISTSLLENARKQISFDLNPVTTLLYGSLKIANNVKEYVEKCKSIEAVQTNADFYNWSRKQQFLSKDQAFVEFTKLLEGKGHEIDSFMAPMLYSGTANYYGVFYGMVIPAIQILGSDEQVEAWLQDSISLKMASCYAQTEIGHGSDVQNLGTLATYDSKSDEFIIHTPTIDAVKFWPGDLGILANWALVFAQLVVDGKNYGVQAFMVPIRDFNTHKPLPGVEVGDIGPKMGYSTKDNGYLRFSNVRVPRFNMLARYIVVEKGGQVKKQGNPKVQYSSMMLMRKLIITVYPRTAASAMVIAIRYSIVRQQFKNDQGIENSVIEYQSQQDKLFPLLANLYSVIFTGIKIGNLVDQNFGQVQKGNFELMNVCHSLLCGTKANFTHFVVNCIEWCRLSCGGHGFAHYSGFPALYQDNSPNVTLEGENQIMYLQLARYLLKMIKLSTKSIEKIPQQFNVFKRLQEILQSKFESIENNNTILLQLLESIVIHQAVQTAQKMMQEISNGIDPQSVWNYKIGTDLLRMSIYFIEYYKYVSFLETIQLCSDQKAQVVLQELATLFAVSTILQDASVLIENQVINQEIIKQLKQLYEDKLFVIKKEAIGLVDAFQYIDEVLRSTIGCYDGKPYERTYNWATQENSFNQADFTESIKQLRQVKPRF